MRVSGTRTVSDCTRFVQFGHWSGTLIFQGERVECRSWTGVRDRSWGVRHQGTAAEGDRPPGSIYAIWSVVHFDDCFLQVTVHEDEQGRGHVRSCVEVPRLAPGDPLIADVSSLPRTDSLTCDIDYRPGTRRPRAARIAVGPRGGLDLELRYEPLSTFQMKGLGYYHPVHRQGAATSGERVHRESWRPAELDPLRVENVHAQQLSIVRRSDGREGVGVFEHVAIGPHQPSGLPPGLKAPSPHRRGCQ